MPFEIRVTNRRRNVPGFVVGRARWMPRGRAIAFVGQDASGAEGIFVQDFVPGQDTTATRRALGGFDPGWATESFGIAPDGSHVIVAGWEQLFSLMMAEGLPGLLPPQRGR